MAPIVVADLGEVGYTTPRGSDKIVTYFAMRSVNATPFQPNSEVDEVAWVPVDKAAAALSYEHDRALVSDLDLDSHFQSGTLYLVRHGSAGSRSTWVGDDRLRPLTKKGVAQANQIADWIRREPLDVLLSSPYLRCVQTLEPLARSTGLEVRIHPYLAEGSTETTTMLNRLRGLSAVVCSHGDAIPWMIEAMVAEGLTIDGAIDCKKGSTWVVTVSGGRFASARYVADATS